MQVDINKKNEAPYAAIASIITPLFNNLPQNCTDYVLNANGKAFEYLSTGETRESRFVLKKDDVYSLAYLLAGFQEKTYLKTILVFHLQSTLREKHELKSFYHLQQKIQSLQFAFILLTMSRFSLFYKTICSTIGCTKL